MTLIADTAAASAMAAGRVDLILVGADRIVANGDTANKVGTYPLAVLARRHDVPFYVVAPTSTLDLATASGADIRIELRDPLEVSAPLGMPFAPEGTPAWNPAFDVTPAELITAVVTERGIARPPYGRSLRDLITMRGAA
jgi:methylthioribose-1-phosphate isomerase